TRQARSVEAILQRAATLGSAAAVVVSREGEVIYRGARGVTRRWDAAEGNATAPLPTRQPAHAVTADTRFDLASVTKPIVAAALLVELERRGAGSTLPWRRSCRSSRARRCAESRSPSCSRTRRVSRP